MVVFKDEESFHKRTHERALNSLKMPPHYLGFTNRTLQQSQPGLTHLYIPVYLALRIKSLQGVDVQNLSGDINGVIMVWMLIQELPEPLVHILSRKIELQVNRSQPLFLRDDHQQGVTLIRTGKMLKFTIRKKITARIHEDTHWSPFEILRLIVTITCNSISLTGTEILTSYLNQYHEARTKIQTLTPIAEQLGLQLEAPTEPPKNILAFDQHRRYIVSFNCMRNGLQIPVSFSRGCVYSIYDMVQTQLESYHTHLDSYWEVCNQSSPEKQSNDKKKNKNALKKYEEPTQDKYYFSPTESQQGLRGSLEQVSDLMQMRKQERTNTDSPLKPKYAQFTHFVVPLYKYPGNSLLTIFIPIVLLAFMSMTVFFQSNILAARIGNIATMVLSYISLVPVVKRQMPPSARVRVIQKIIYAQTLCSLFPLIQSFLLEQYDGQIFVWIENVMFLLCAATHFLIFLFMMALYLIHKFYWEPSYNEEHEGIKADPEQYPYEWINMYCDEQFYLANDKIYTHNSKHADRPKPMITKYSAPVKVQRKIQDREGEAEKKEQKAEGQECEQIMEKKTKKKSKKRKGKQEDKYQAASINTVQEVISKVEDKKDPGLIYQKALRHLDRVIEEGKHISWLVYCKEKQNADKVKRE